MTMWIMIVALSTTAFLAYTVSIVGAQGRLGRELVFQSLARGWAVEGVVRRPLDPVLMPTREGWLSPRDENVARPIRSDRLQLTTNATVTENVDAIVFCMSSDPFATRESMEEQTGVVKKMLDTCSPHVRVCLVSAHGAGNSLGDANLGIKLMHSYYLKEAYAAKEEQETYVANRNVTHLILRPRVLSFSKIPLNPVAVPRYELARHITNWILRHS